MGQDVWAESPHDSCEHVATVVSANASEVTVVWAHTNEREIVDIGQVRPMFAFESWVRTTVPTNANVKQSARFRELKVSLSPDCQDTNEEIVKLQAALTSANRKAEMQQAEIEKLRWKNQCKTNELEEIKKLVAWQSYKLDAMNNMDIDQTATMKKRHRDEMELANSRMANDEKKLKDKCEDQMDQIAMLEYEGEELRVEIDELIKAAKKTNEKVAERDGAISKSKTSCRPIRSLDLSPSKRKCVPLKQPLPSKFQGDAEKAKSTTMPGFTNLVNFPADISQKQPVPLPNGMRCCVMCGQACQCNGTVKERNPGVPAAPAAGGAIIPTQNKGLCNVCDVKVWVVVQSGLEIKWCKRCKNFRSWASFGDKGLARKCVPCREHQREKYRARQKEAKEKKKSNALKGV